MCLCTCGRMDRWMDSALEHVSSDVLLTVSKLQRVGLVPYPPEKNQNLWRNSRFVTHQGKCELGAGRAAETGWVSSGLGYKELRS